MDKFILIDGNSLLNRAFYAMQIFTTKDGLPTNGIFGFIKLLFKIIEDEKPRYLAVTFDLHAPTFRHKMYGGYKATRKPMPEELVRQVPVLKELLAAMNIRIVEKEGFEADDLIGTLSRKWGDVEVLIYTGDRDAYQLVRENVKVCFTRKGVSDIDLLTADNFREKVGLEPWQIIEEKALKGDSSDNIPGVPGIGAKGAERLLAYYGDLEEVYRNLDALAPSLRKKLEEGRELAVLSKTLATIDTNVPLDVDLEDCALELPFSGEARAFFAKLEFRSLMDNAFFTAERASEATVKEYSTSDIDGLLREIEDTNEFALCFENNVFHVYFNGVERLLPLRENFLTPGMYPDEMKAIFEKLFGASRHAVVSDVKGLCHRLDELGFTLPAAAEDVSLLRYLIDSNLRAANPSDYAKDRNLPEDQMAYALSLAYEESKKEVQGTAEERLYRELELPLAYVLYDMERTGVRVDVSRFSVLSENYNREIEELSQNIFRLAGVKSFNLNSPLQLSQLLFEKLGYPTNGVKKNARGYYTTGADVLERLARDYEIPRLVLRYRELQKLLSTYVEGIRPLVTPQGIVHTTYNQTMTTTGRLSSANPNLQNIPVRREEGRELRKLFVAREGNLLVDADYSQIELRLLAHFSGCKPLIEAYREGRDIHAATAAQVFGVSLSEVTPLMRRRAKTINFGIIYGMSAFGLAKDLGCSASEAQAYIDKYFQEYSSVKEYMDENVRFAKENGYIMTILGRKRHIQELKSPIYNVRAFGERAAMNMPLQGSSADIIKIAMLKVWERLKAEGLQTKLVMQVHDELVLDAPEAEAERAAVLLKEEMEKAIGLSVPLVAEVSTGKNWYEAK